MLNMGDPQNQGFQSWNGLMTWMMSGYPILGNLHFVLRREGNFRCNFGSTLMEPSLTCPSRGGWWLIWGLPNYIYIYIILYYIYIYIILYIYILQYIYIYTPSVLYIYTYICQFHPVSSSFLSNPLLGECFLARCPRSSSRTDSQALFHGTPWEAVLSSA
jgi:hypothetical protein